VNSSLFCFIVAAAPMGVSTNLSSDTRRVREFGRRGKRLGGDATVQRLEAVDHLCVRNAPHSSRGTDVCLIGAHCLPIASLGGPKCTLVAIACVHLDALCPKMLGCCLSIGRRVLGMRLPTHIRPCCFILTWTSGLSSGYIEAMCLGSSTQCALSNRITHTLMQPRALR
jgi:hypothetical protein